MMTDIILRMGVGVGSSNRTEKVSISFTGIPSVEQVIQHISQYYNEDLTGENLVVVINGRVIQDNEYQEYIVNNGDTVSIFRAIAGG